MSVETDLYTQMSTYAGLTALVGTRTYPDEAPQGVSKPYCVYEMQDDGRQYTHDGHSPPDRPEFIISSYGETRAQAVAVAEQVTLAIEAWPGANAKVQAAFKDGKTDIYQQEVKLYCAEAQYFVWYG